MMTLAKRRGPAKVEAIGYHFDAQKLSPRESEVLSALEQGVSYKGAAHQLHITINTIRARVRGILLKTESHSILESLWRRRNLR